MINFAKINLFVEILLGLHKSIYFNLKYFKIKDAIKLPVLLSGNVELKSIKGCVELGRVKTGVVRIGFGDVGIFDKKHKTIIQFLPNSEIKFKGKAGIGHGSSLSVSGKLYLGDNFLITAESKIIARKKIIFGDNVLVSWDVIVMDSDFHSIYGSHGEILNESKDVIVGDNVWIGCRVMILKGTVVGGGNVIAAGSKIAGNVDIDNVILANDASVKVLKTNILWKI